jgi:hypothetical protein
MTTLREEIKRHFYYYINEHIDKTTIPLYLFFVWRRIRKVSERFRAPKNRLQMFWREWRDSGMAEGPLRTSCEFWIQYECGTQTGSKGWHQIKLYPGRPLIDGFARTRIWKTLTVFLRPKSGLYSFYITSVLMVLNFESLQKPINIRRERSIFPFMTPSKPYFSSTKRLLPYHQMKHQTRLRGTINPSSTSQTVSGRWIEATSRPGPHKGRPENGCQSGANNGAIRQ